MRAEQSKAVGSWRSQLAADCYRRRSHSQSALFVAKSSATRTVADRLGAQSLQLAEAASGSLNPLAR